MKFASVNTPLLSSELTALFEDAPKLSQAEFIAKIYDLSPWLLSLVTMSETFLRVKSIANRGDISEEQKERLKQGLLTSVAIYEEEYKRVQREFELSKTGVSHAK